MKTHRLLITIIPLVLTVIPIYAQESKRDAGPSVSEGVSFTKDISLLLTIIALPNLEASQFSANHNFSSKPANALADLEKLAVDKKAFSIANLAVTTRSGQRATSDAGQLILDVETQLSKDQKIAEVVVNIVNKGHRIATTIQTTKESVVFLGSIPSSADKTLTEYMFLRVSY